MWMLIETAIRNLPKLRSVFCKYIKLLDKIQRFHRVDYFTEWFSACNIVK